MSDIIDPKTLRGFRDSLPRAELGRLQVQEKLTRVFRRFGFVPIDTPALEYAEILLGKGGGETDKQVYRFRDHGHRDVALRFDLTVPFARFMAAHVDELYLPFKRYHMAKVWRGENTQRGRYREFIQIDFDLVGADSASADLEILMLMQESFRELGVPRFRIHLSHRELFNALPGRPRPVGKLPVECCALSTSCARSGRQKCGPSSSELAGETSAGEMLEFVSSLDSDRETLRRVGSLLPADCPPIQRLDALWRCIEDCGLGEFFHFDPAITRGLDYYTGVVFETFLGDLPDIGSVCSGGRYNDLASLYTREKLPGVGASIGLDRLMAALEELGLAAGAAAAPDVVVLLLDEALLSDYHRLAYLFAGRRFGRGSLPRSPQAGRAAQVRREAGHPPGRDLRAAGTGPRAVHPEGPADRRSHEGLTDEALAETAARLLRS